MTYSVKECFYTLQGEGVQTGRAAVFLRFAGCNLWSGLERDRASAVCKFCDTDFFGTDGPQPIRFDHKVTPAYSWPADRLAELLADAGLVPFARLLHDPASERGFLDAHLLARRT